MSEELHPLTKVKLQSVPRSDRLPKETLGTWARVNRVLRWHEKRAKERAS